MIKTSIFGGGCFWCTEAIFKKINGVKSVLPGYIGGHIVNPTYEQVCTGTTGHSEVIKIEYDSSVISFNDLLAVFFSTHDPTTLNRQGNDVGTQYRTEIFTIGGNQKKLAEKSKVELESSGKFNKPIVTAITVAPEFYIAEEYHQDFYKKQSMRYQMYAQASGRKGYLENTWRED